MISPAGLETEIASASASLSQWTYASYGSILVVFIGVVVESLAILVNWSPEKDDLKKKVEKVGALILILGLAGEILTTVKTSEWSSKEVALLNKQTVRERLAIEGRDLSPEEQRSLGKELAGFAGQPAIILIYLNDFEAGWFAGQLASALKFAGHWDISASQVHEVNEARIGKMVSGLMVIFPADDKGRKAGEALLSALGKRGFCGGGFPPDVQHPPPPVVTIIVGTKSRHGNCK